MQLTIMDWYSGPSHKLPSVVKLLIHCTTMSLRIFKLLWDFSIQTDKKLDHNHPNIVFVYKQNKNCLIINIACPSDRRVDIKQEEKVNKYLDLTVEIKALWKIKEC